MVKSNRDCCRLILLLRGFDQKIADIVFVNFKTNQLNDCEGSILLPSSSIVIKKIKMDSLSSLPPARLINCNKKIKMDSLSGLLLPGLSIVIKKIKMDSLSGFILTGSSIVIKKIKMDSLSGLLLPGSPIVTENN